MTRRLLILLIAGLWLPACAEESPSLEGLWKAHKRFDPYQEGPLLLDFDSGMAEFSGHHAAITGTEGRFTVEFSEGIGSFHGRVMDGDIKAHWRQPGPMQMGMRVATPVDFSRLDENRWSGHITPMQSEFTFYLPISGDENGVLQTFLRNPDRNLGVFSQIHQVRLDGSDLEFVGNLRGSDNQEALFTGQYDSEYDLFTMNLPPWRGGVYEFHREDPPGESGFHARPESAGPWAYQPPVVLGDGWSVSTLDAARISEEPIRQMIEKEISAQATDVHALDVHGVLIARGGKLVLEEYFHGFHRDLPHDTRSAGKSLASVLVGAVIEQGADLSPATPVFQHLGENTEGLDARKKAMTLEHLLTMSSGFYCDDNDGNAPGNEDTLQSQETQPDWYRYTLDLPMADDPGSNPVYCSANSNLIGAVVSVATGRPLTELVQDLVAEPLDIKNYWLNLQPTGELYFGGGSHWLPRDYMKLAQLMLNGGTWNGKRIVSEEWAKRSTSESVRLRERAYGWQWWVNEYYWHGKTVQAFFAAGNGGQIFMGIPAADLVIAFWGGNYSDRTLYRAQNELIPEYILPAVQP